MDRYERYLCETEAGGIALGKWTNRFYRDE
jgi:hypothetical protein